MRRLLGAVRPFKAFQMVHLNRMVPMMPWQSRCLTATAREREPAYASGDLTGYQVYRGGDFELESGAEVKDLAIAYETWGELNHRRDNAILLQCGMSASSHAKSNAANGEPGWWEDFIGPGRPLDTNHFHIICTNNLGGCYGSSGPSSLDPTGRHYGSRFPRFSVQDMVNAQFELISHLNIGKLHACVGASLGGMLSVCSAANHPDRVGKVVSISACAKSFPGSIAFRHTQRTAIMSDPAWNGGDYYGGELPASGLQLARQIGTITYRSGLEWQARFGQDKQAGERPEGGRQGRALEEEHSMANELKIEHYLAHQGRKWVDNYDPNSMLWISKAMDSFSLEKEDENGQLSLLEGLKGATMPALVIGVQHDVLFPVWQQKEIADSLKANGNESVCYYELDSLYGHDAFLLESAAIGPAVKGHLEQEPGGVQQHWEEMAASTSRILQLLVMKRNSADSMSDIFRSLAAGQPEVETERLLAVVKLIYQTQVPELTIEQVFKESFSTPTVTLDAFLSVRTKLANDEEYSI